MQVLFYQTASGRIPVREALLELPREDSAFAYELLKEIEETGFQASRVVFRQIKSKLWEIKMNLPGTGGYRIFYFTVRADTLLLLHSYVKKSQKSPQRHIETAEQRMRDAMKRSSR